MITHVYTNSQCNKIYLMKLSERLSIAYVMTRMKLLAASYNNRKCV